jgi:site-specific recombinase XerD
MSDKIESSRLDSLRAAVRSYSADAKARRTVRAYEADWSTFSKWCSVAGLVALPATAEVVALYCAYRAQQGRKVATITRELAAISQAHKVANYPSPTTDAQVLETMKGVRRSLGVAQAQKAPVLIDDLRAMVTTLPETLLGRRDRALLVTGFAGALRRSELVALAVADLEFTAAGLVISLRRSKTDQEGEGRRIGLPCGRNAATCPVRSMRAWLDEAGIKTGPVFRAVSRHGRVAGAALCDRAVALIVKRSAAAAGLDPSRFSGHSLRAGLATAAAKAGKSERAIMHQTGHRSVVMVRRYIRNAGLFDDNAAGGIGL